VFSAKSFLTHYGSSCLLFDDIKDYKSLNFRSNYLLNFLLSDIDSYNSYFMLNVTLRYESPLFNSRLRKSYLKI